MTPISTIQSQLSQADDSAWEGRLVSVKGIVTGVFGNLFFLQEELGGPWSGISVYRVGHSVVQGDEIVVTGTVVEYYDLTQIEPITIQVLSSNNPLPTPHLLTARAAQDERWESVLVRLEQVVVVAGPDNYGEWRIRDDSGTLLVDDKGSFYQAEPGELILVLTAIVDHAFGSYRLIPRTLKDIVGEAGDAASLPTDLTPIYIIQGDGPTTPLEGNRVSTSGVVTAVDSRGFFLQDPVGDGDLNTSDGIYVFTHSPPPVSPGQCVLVQDGLVSEYYARTELSRIAGIHPVQSCATTIVQPVPVSPGHLNRHPAQLFERYEGMLVAVENLDGTAQAPTQYFQNGEAEISFVATPLLPYLPGGRVFQGQSEKVTALTYLNNRLGAVLPDVAWGDRIVGGPEVTAGSHAVTAILDYSFGKYQFLLLPAEQITVQPAQRLLPPIPVVNAGSDDEFTICTYNLYGLGRGSDQIQEDQAYAGQLYKRALTIAEILQGCTIIGLQETATPVDADNLATVLREEFHLDYSAIAIAGPGSVDPAYPLTNSLLARKERVEILDAELRQGCSRLDYGISAGPENCPPGQYPLFNRPPLVVDLAVQGDWGEPYRLTAIVNHWKSKGGDEQANLVRRTEQARHVASLVRERRQAQPRIVVLGDLNDFQGSAPIETLRMDIKPGLIQVLDYLSPLDRFTFIYDGASQVLDYILITPAMLPEFAGIEVAHVNADFSATQAADPTTVYRSSDHDPVRLRVRPDGAGWIGGALCLPGIRVTLQDQQGSVVAEAITDALGHFRLWNVIPGRYALGYTLPDYATITRAEQPVTVSAGAGVFFEPQIGHRAAEAGLAMAYLSPGTSTWAQ